MTHEGYQEVASELSDETKDMHRAIQSLIAELEAVGFYSQHAYACKDEDLKETLAHNGMKGKNVRLYYWNGYAEEVLRLKNNLRIIFYR